MEVISRITSEFTGETLTGLFNLMGSRQDIDPASIPKSMEYMYMYASLLARAESMTTERFIQSIQVKRNAQTIVTKNVITQAVNATNKQNNDSDWKAKAGIAPSGFPTTDPPKEENCASSLIMVFVAIAAIVLAPFTAGVSLLIGGAILLVAYMIASLGALIAKAVHGEDSAEYRDIMAVFEWINPVAAFTNFIVGVYCEITGKSRNDEDVQKFSMKLRLALDILVVLIELIVSIIIAVVLATVTVGAATPLAAALVAAVIAQLVVALITAGTGIASGVMEYQRANKALTLAKQKLELAKINALVEKMKAELQVIGKEIDMIVEVFTSHASKSREQYERAEKILKEYNDTKLNIINNLSA
jgi:hypothetical protein